MRRASKVPRETNAALASGLFKVAPYDFAGFFHSGADCRLSFVMLAVTTR